MGRFADSCDRNIKPTIVKKRLLYRASNYRTRKEALFRTADILGENDAAAVSTDVSYVQLIDYHVLYIFEACARLSGPSFVVLRYFLRKPQSNHPVYYDF